MQTELSTSAQKVQRALQGFDLSLQVVELPASTRTAVEAARAIGCEIGQIVKSLVFRTTATGKPVLVLASGVNRVSEVRLGPVFGESLKMADAEFVRQYTGFAIGGVPPVGFSQPIETIIDQDLLQYAEIWAAAGTPHAVFCLSPTSLAQITNGRVMQIS
jgi:prolyl-tRNA editing enzyme YbaK/EbsC (Cys-tRNA(Pro) deacylase)